MLASRTPRLRKLLALMAVGLALVVALELGLRVYAHATLRERGMTFDPDFGWRMLPNVQKRSAFWGATEPATTNSKGWRDAETTYAKPPGTTRIVVLGDSFTFASSVDYGERFTEVLEEAREDLEVVNLGVNAYGTDQELRVLELEGLRYDPDVVVLVAYLGNDLDDNMNDRSNYWPKPYYTLEEGRLEFVPAEPSWDVRLRTGSYVGEALFRLVRRGVNDFRFAEVQAATSPIELFASLVGRMAERSEERGARFLVVAAYSREAEAALPDPREAVATRRLQNAGIEVLDTWTLVDDALAAGVEVFGPDRHWNIAGHALIAEAIRSKLVEAGWL